VADFDCRRCRDWKGCPGKEWYHFGEFVFCVHQMYWVIQNWETFSEGTWPTQETDDNSTTRQIKAEASFVKAELIFSETSERLEQYPQSVREHLFDVINAGVEIHNLSRTPRDALYYISGWPRKEMSFSKWRWQKNNRKSEDKISSKVGT
jgi:hypothetical protein